MSKKSTDILPVEDPQSLLPIGIDDYEGISLSSGASERLGRLLLSTKAGLVSTTPIVCKGPTKCPFIERCPIWQDAQATGERAQYPLNRQCIVELNIIRDKFLEYVEEFGVQNQIENSPTIRSQVSKLAELDLYDYRTNLVLAGATNTKVSTGLGTQTVKRDQSDGTLLYEQTIAVTQDEEEIKQLQEHPAWKIKERIHKQRMDLLDALGATIKRKVWIDATLKRTSQENVFQKQMELLEKVDNLMDALEDDTK